MALGRSTSFLLEKLLKWMLKISESIDTCFKSISTKSPHTNDSCCICARMLDRFSSEAHMKRQHLSFSEFYLMQTVPYKLEHLASV